MDYPTLRLIHIGCAVASGLGFFARRLLMMRASPLLNARWVRVVPHVVDTLLLGASTTASSPTIQRELGIQLVDGRMPGFAAILGPAPSHEIAVHTVRELQKRSILTFLVCNRDGKTMADQLIEQGVELGWDTYIVPVGKDTHSAIYVLDWAIRGALMFGGHKKGDWRNCLRYTRERIFAFGLTFGPIPDDWYAVGAGAIVMGFPVISDHESTPVVHPTGVTTYEALVRQTDHKQIVPTCIQVRGVKVKVEELPKCRLVNYGRATVVSSSLIYHPFPAVSEVGRSRNVTSFAANNGNRLRRKH